MNLDLLAAHPLIALVLSQLLGAALMLVAILILFPRHRHAVIDPVIAWARRTFTTAGDGCTNCQRSHQPVHCLVCRRTVMLRPAEVIHSRDLSAAIDEELRRRAALIAYDEIELDLEEQAVH